MKISLKHILISAGLVLITIAFVLAVNRFLNGNAEQSQNLFEEFTSRLSLKFIPFLGLAALLMPCNWGLESLKWGIFVRSFEQPSNYKKVLKSLLSGVLMGTITPNRIGEFGGRMVFISKPNWAKGISAGAWGGVAQFIVTYSIGVMFGLQFVVLFIKRNIDADLPPFWFFALLAIGIIVLSFWMYFKFPLVLKWISSLQDRFTEKSFWFNSINRLNEKIKKLDLSFEVSKGELILVFIITLLRYLVYVHQYILVFWFFGADVAYQALFGAVVTMLVLHTLTPSLPLLDVAVKYGALFLLLTPHGVNELTILCASATIYLINHLTPSLVGYVLVVRSGMKNMLNLKGKAMFERVKNN